MFLGGRFLKRAWTKKVKAVLGCAIEERAPDGKLKPVQPKVKLRLFRTSAAMIGLTVSIGTPNLLLTLGSDRAPAAQTPTEDESLASMTASRLNIATEAPGGQIAPASAPIEVTTAQKLEAQVAKSDRPLENRTGGQALVKAKVQRNALPVVQFSAPTSNQVEVTATVKEVAPTAPVQNYGAIAPQVDPVPVVANTEPVVIATPTASRVNRLVARLQANKNAGKQVESRRPQSAPLPASTAEQLVVQPQTKEVDLEANSAWTAKQRLLVERLRQEPSSQLSSASQPMPAVEQAQAQTNKIPTLVVQEQKSFESNDNNVVVEAQPIGPVAPTIAGNTPQLPEVAANKSTQFEARSLQPKSSVDRLVERLNLSPTQTTEGESVAEATADDSNVVPKAIASNEDPAIVAQEQLETMPSSAFVLPAAETPELASSSHSEGIDQSPTEVATTPVSPASAAVESATMEVVNSADGSTVAAPTPEYQVKPGDTLSAIATEHKVSVPEIISANRLGNPDLLLVDQRIKLPSLTPSTAEKVTVAVLPEIKQVPMLVSAPVAQTVAPSNLNSKPNAVLVAAISDMEQPTKKLANSYNGVGGSFGDEVETKPLNRVELDKLQAQYAQKLQSDVQKLQHKYYAQNNSSNLSTPIESRLPAVIKPPSTKKLSADEPVNPDFVVAQTAQDLKQPSQKQLTIKANYSVPVKGRVATAPTDVSSASESFTGQQQVTPELPPLAPVDNYLPRPNGNSGSFKGYIWPAKGVLSSKYGWRWGRMHRGIDIAAPVGTPIFAAAEGVVVKSGWNKGGYGNLVDIQHADGTVTRYAHNYRLLVQPGQQVEQGQQISLMGSTGRSTGPHLHFEVRPSGKGAVNPIALLPKK